MGKSSSCFRLITCGGDAAEKDDHHHVVSEIKDSNDKSGWSFRKRSARHRVLSNTVITETPSSANKDTSECTSINFQSQDEPNVVEKTYTTNISDEKTYTTNVSDEKTYTTNISDEKTFTTNVADEKSYTTNSSDEKIYTTNISDEKTYTTNISDEKTYTTNNFDEKPQLSSLASQEVSEKIVTETEGKVDVNQQESAVIIIQAAIRGFLARRALLKNRNALKLQAAFRGHLVRRHAVGTLRCVQAIVKMQLLVRARRAQQGNEHLVTKSNVTHTSTEKLLNNRFARQLLESSSKKKLINVKCDPSKADSAWKWLERWMSVSSKDPADSKKPISVSEDSEQSDETKGNPNVSQLETVIPSEGFLQLADSKPTVADSPLLSEDEEKTITYEANTFSFQSSYSTSPVLNNNLEQAPSEKTITDDAIVTATEVDSFQNEKVERDASVPQEPSFLLQKPEIDGEQQDECMETFASDQQESEGRKPARGSRKSSNPAFIAAQSKFEELSSMANSGRSSSLSNQDASIESQPETSSVVADNAHRSKEFFFSENPAPFPSLIGGSECGTELSISSTLDSPDRSEFGVVESEHHAKDFVEGTGNPGNKIDNGVEAEILSATPTTNLPNLDPDQVVIVHDIGSNTVHPVVLGDTKEPAVEPEKNASEILREQTEMVVQDFKLSPEASPISHMTVPESQGTPSSQVSVKTKDSKVKKSGSSHKRKILSAGSKSPVNTNHDSGSRGSKEQLPKDQHSGKRRNSFGSVKSDHVDQEPRDTGSNNSSLPHFMQATQSARAKINANNSPRSSPDVHDQDIQLKKRHSLPGATGRQGSPRIQQSPQAQQDTKGNALHERKWQR